MCRAFGPNAIAPIPRAARALRPPGCRRVEDLARHTAISPRTFARQFRQQTGTTPHQWLTHQRLLAAQMRLEMTDDRIDAIAEAVGLQTAATLRQHFSRTLDTTPTAYRRRFSTT
jgi:transcriptional regulator GlxA family with amidase domain